MICSDKLIIREEFDPVSYFFINSYFSKVVKCCSHIKINVNKLKQTRILCILYRGFLSVLCQIKRKQQLQEESESGYRTVFQYVRISMFGKHDPDRIIFQMVHQPPYDNGIHMIAGIEFLHSSVFQNII